MGITNTNTDYAGECDPTNNGQTRRIQDLPDKAGLPLNLANGICLFKWVGFVGETAILRGINGVDIPIPLKYLRSRKVPFYQLGDLPVDSSHERDANSLVTFEQITSSDSKYDIDYLLVTTDGRPANTSVLNIKAFVVKPMEEPGIELPIRK